MSEISSNTPVTRYRHILIAGACGGIGSALVARLCRMRQPPRLTTLARSDIPVRHAGHIHHTVTLSEPESVDAVAQFLADNDLTPDCVIHCAGTLSGAGGRPEKALRQLDTAALEASLRVNVATHIHLAQALESRLSRRHSLVWASLSAKIGSIGDNRRGGWYSYRMSKSALNMFVRTLAIEWQRKLETICAVAIHPGTTDTPLTEPFQRTIATDRLYSRATTAQRLLTVIDGLSEQDNGTFLSWDGSPLPW